MNKDINSFDIETFLEDGFFEPFCVSFYLFNKNKSFYFNNGDNLIMESIKYIFDQIKNNCVEIFYIHNLKFDGTLIIHNLSKYSLFKISALIEKKEFYSIRITYNEKSIEFRCSYKLLPISLYNISIGFDIKKKMDYPYEFVNKKNLFWNKEIDKKFFKSEEGFLIYNQISDLKKFTIIYCENDCFITKTFVEKIFKIFFDSFGIDIIKNNILSTPSLSFHTFYKKFNSKKIEKFIEKEKELYIRDSYFGGRCEVFGNPGNFRIFHYDFPGMYGLCMKEKNVFGKSYFKYDIEENKDLKPGFYNINWESDMSIPILPHHNQINNKLLFCNGKGNGTYWFEEINLFKEKGGKILKINSGLLYENYDYVFKDFVEHFESFRNINNEHKILGKLIINSFYGRTGLSLKEEFSFFLNNKEELDWIMNLSEDGKINIIDIEEINNLYLITLKIDKNSKKILEEKNIYARREKNLNIAVASSISSKARVKLYKAFDEVLKNKGKILYCDTDSIFAEFRDDVANTRMGDIFWDNKKEDTVVDDCVFILPKTYGILLKNKEIIKIKGVTRNYIEFNELKRKFYNKENFIAENLKSIRYNNFKVEYRESQKKIDLLAYDKRKFLENLKDTRPFIFCKGEYI